MAKVHGESKLTFLESTSIIIGHGVGSGILSVPFLASRNNWHDIIWIAAVAYCMNLLLHFMIAELSLNNNGAQFIKCFENELFVGKLKMACTWLAFGLLGFSVVVNVSGFIITGAAAVFSAWFHLPSVVGMLLFYVLAASVVYIGMKLVGICEKIAVISMFGVIGILFVATMLSETTELSTKFYSNNNMLALYSMIAFSLSAVMSVPQVVKGLEGDEKGIRRAIAAGTGLNMGLILLITFMTLLGCSNVTENGALVDLSGHLGGWVSIIGYVFSLLALATSFWANTLNLRDIVNEQTKWGEKISWLAATLPCLVIALVGVQSFVGFTRMASVVQVLTGVGVIVAYNRSRKRAGTSLICGRLGSLPFQILAVAASLVASVGAVLTVTV